MPSQLKLLRESRKNGTFDLVDRGINRRISASNTRRGHSLSPNDEDNERIIRNYVDESYLNNVVSKKTALESIKSLEEDKAKRGLKRDFTNYISGVGRNKLAEYIFKKYGREKISIVKNSKIKTKSDSERVGYKINSRIYLITIKTKTGKEYLQARRFKDNRITKMRKSYLRFN
ncbi:MAG: hypothetical protein WCX82_04925 [archaeon]|jgi:hypothetical protein